MLVLRVLTHEDIDDATVARLSRRFGRFFDGIKGLVDYPVTSDTHAEDVLRDEFGEPPMGIIWAGLAEADDVEWYEPFHQDEGGPLNLESIYPE
jgi:hypothetical protein